MRNLQKKNMFFPYCDFNLFRNILILILNFLTFGKEEENEL